MQRIPTCQPFACAELQRTIVTAVRAERADESLCILTTPVSSVRRTQKEVLQNDDHKVPENDLAPEHRFVE